jgi:Cu(I)/Ag(I) efflux system periplasmic protein CusF
MKRLLAISAASAVLAAVPLFVIAQPGGMADMDMKDHKGNNAQAKVHKASGKVVKVDAARNAVTIAHDAVSTMNWPAMTMTFKVRDKALLKKMKQGDQAEFEFVQQGKDYVVTSVN